MPRPATRWMQTARQLHRPRLAPMRPSLLRYSPAVAAAGMAVQAQTAVWVWVRMEVERLRLVWVAGCPVPSPHDDIGAADGCLYPVPSANSTLAAVLDMLRLVAPLLTVDQRPAAQNGARAGGTLVVRARQSSPGARARPAVKTALARAPVPVAGSRPRSQPPSPRSADINQVAFIAWPTSAASPCRLCTLCIAAPDSHAYGWSPPKPPCEMHAVLTMTLRPTRVAVTISARRFARRL